MPERDIQTIIDELKATYKTTDLTVSATSDREEYTRLKFATAKPELLQGKDLPDDFTGMFFMPAVNTVDNQSHIGIHLPSFDPSLYRDELTHEFSNYEVWRRWGDQLKQYQERADRYQVELSQNYKARIEAQANQSQQQMLLSGVHPAQRILEARTVFGFAVYDTVVSVPTDHITAGKGFGDRLIRRKADKMKAWLSYMSPNTSSRLWISGNFPYLAYNSFHPNSPNAERELDSSVRQILQVVDYDSMITPIRRIREMLHSIRTPVDATNLVRTNIEAEKVYYSFQAERSADHMARKYWNMLKDSARAVTSTVTK
ncbi:hypothetical protein HYS92_02435 [Candidatus Daviesbacteria bacterium]|nr:hypothetical protein [Candidatus Daviesbacteria bacterium]